MSMIVRDTMTFAFHGTVKGKARPRFCRNGHAYSSPGTYEYEKAIWKAWRDWTGGKSFGSAPVRVVIDVIRQLPSSRPKRIKYEPDTFKPDADNIAKAVLDALQGKCGMGAFEDDSQVVELRIIKHDRRRNDGGQDVMYITIEKVEGV